MRKPLVKLTAFANLSVEQLHAFGKDVLFLDADNTLFLPNIPLTEQMVGPIRSQLMDLKKAGITIVIISNNFSAEKSDFFAKLAIPTIFFAKKPLPFAYRKAHKQVEKLVGPIAKDAIVHLGDQLLTDVFGSILYGIDYMMVEPIDQKADLIFAKPSRWLEKILRLKPHE